MRSIGLARRISWSSARRAIAARRTLLGNSIWIAGQHGAEQVLRLGTNIVIARLLAPELLGTMLLINTLRTGGELLSDLGIGQSIVSDPQGRDPKFFNTAWTLQIIRGVVLFAIGILAAEPLARLYDSPELRLLIPVAAVVFLLSGLKSPSKFLLQKDMQVRRLALLGIGTGISSSIVHIGLALYTPTIWALIGGLLLSTAGGTIVSFFLIDWRIHAIRFDKDSARSILIFGKWVFASSLVFFLAMNFDRLYFAGAVPLATLGVYGIARTFSDTFTQLFIRLSRMLIFPKVAASRDRIGQLKRDLIPLRRVAVFSLAVVLGGVLSVSDLLIHLAYDARYADAAVFLPILLVGAWFATLASAGEAMMLGIGNSAGMAISNAAKLSVIVVAVPLILPIGLVPAIIVIVLAEAVRYGVLVWRKRAHGLSFIRQDVGATALFLFSAAAFRELAYLIGLTDGALEWLSSMRGFVG
jgi:O-antigen/teichoic acid export membrane protein